MGYQRILPLLNGFDYRSGGLPSYGPEQILLGLGSRSHFPEHHSSRTRNLDYHKDRTRRQRA